VTIYDNSGDSLDAAVSRAPGVAAVQSDLLREGAVSDAVRDCDIAVGAVPGFMGFRTLAAVLEAGKDVVDISFFEQDPMQLQELAKRGSCRCLVDFGIAPGCTNLFFGRCRKLLSRIRVFECYVGGLPRERRLPWQYKAPFSPVDVLEEYVRPARLIRDGALVTLPALSEPELMDFDGVGTLEGFLTDTLRTLLQEGVDLGLESMIEKTLRYPGHRERVQVLLDAGLLSSEPLEVAGHSVSPLELTGRLLIPAWHLGEGERDLTALRVIATGTDAAGRAASVAWEMLDEYDSVSRTTSMARTTGYTCTAGVRLLAAGLWSETGIATPQTVGMSDACYRFILDRLAERNVLFDGGRLETG
ncbi:hypothetical protein JW921_06525, partial [Candidatus Fermentibacterales bacterium]|nr:hypothetical protein [Candidatus Fermentibacterales bacterium]